MRACAQCGTPVGDTWEHCLRCGEELPPPPDPEPGALQRLRSSLARTNDGSSGGPSDRSVKLAAVARGLREARVPAWALGAALAAVVLALAVGIAAAASGGGTDPAVIEARDAAQAEATRLSSALTTAEQTRDQLTTDLEAAQAEIASLEEQLESGSGDLAQLQEESTRLQGELDTLRTQFEELTAEADARAIQTAALMECLDGTEVAYQFARDGLIAPADLAMQSITDACATARGG